MLAPPVVRSGNATEKKKRAVTSARRGDTDSKSEANDTPPVSVPRDSIPRDKAKVVPIGSAPAAANSTQPAGTASIKGGVGVVGGTLASGSIDVTGNASLLASVNAGNGAVGANGLVEIGPIGGAAGAANALLAGGERAASSVHFLVHRWWLNFTSDRWLEEQFELLLDVSVPEQAKIMLWMMIALVGLGLVFDGVYYHEDTTSYAIRLAICGGALLCALLQFILRHTRVSVFWLCVMFIGAGGGWAIRSVLFNHDLLRPTESSSVVCALIVLHASCGGKLLRFPSSVIASYAIVATYIITAFLTRADAEPLGLCIYHALLVVFANTVLCYSSYSYEYLSREKLVSTTAGKLLAKERAAFEKEAYELRNEVYVMTLEQYDLAELDKVIDLGSPVEKAMAKLQAIQANKKIPKDVFLEVKAIIQLLGSSSDIFKPQIEEELVNKNIGLDMETEKWIVDLVNGDIGGGGRRKTLDPQGGNAENKNELSTTGSPGSSGATSAAGSGSASSRSDGTPAPSGLLQHAQAALAAKAAGIAGTVQSSEEKQFSAMLEETENWNFDVFEVHRATNGRPLLFLGMALFQKYDLVNKFKMDTQKLKKFLTVIERGYRSNPYHNSTHAADVTRSVHFFLTRCGLRTYMVDIEIFAAIFAAVIHDYDHPGRTNAYHIATSDEKAILYNDRSVLENHHCAQAWFELLKPDQNFTTNVSKDNLVLFRKQVVELVLATDLGMHFDIISQFKSAVQGGQIVKSSDKSRLLINKMALKCGDLGHSAKNLVLHKRWTDRITEEFFQQGDDERKKGLTISPFMDRHKPNVPQSQVGFLDFLVIPMFNVWTTFVSTEVSEEQFPCMKQLTENHTHWKTELEAQKKAGVKT